MITVVSVIFENSGLLQNWYRAQSFTYLMADPYQDMLLHLGRR